MTPPLLDEEEGRESPGSHLRAGVPVRQIVGGAFNSVINRVVEMDPLDGEAPPATP